VDREIDLMLEMKKCFRLLFANKLLILSIGILFGVSGYFYAKLQKPIYNAGLTFSIKSDNGTFASISNLSSLLGGGSNPSGSPLERTMGVLQSESLIMKVLFSTTQIGQKKDLFINHFIDIYEYRSKWAESKDTSLIQLKNVQFKPYNSLENLNLEQKKVLKIILSKISNPSLSLLKPSFDKKSGIIALNFDSINEELSINFTLNLYQVLVEFYNTESNTNSSKNLYVIERKVDSIKTLLYQTQMQSAQINDQALGVILQKDRVDAKSTNVKENMLMIAYGEAQKNLETLRFMTSSSKTLFTILEYPFSPIRPTQKSKIIFAGFGLFLGFFLSFSFLRFRLFFRENDLKKFFV
jgi:hypothetical protein